MRHLNKCVCKTENCRLCVTTATVAWVNSLWPDCTDGRVVLRRVPELSTLLWSLCDGNKTRSCCTPSSPWAINECAAPFSPERERERERPLIIGNCSQYRCTDLSHAQMTVIWSRRNTGLSAGRGLLLFSGEDGCSFLLLAFHYNSLLMSTPHTPCHFRWATLR